MFSTRGPRRDLPPAIAKAPQGMFPNGLVEGVFHSAHTLFVDVYSIPYQYAAQECLDQRLLLRQNINDTHELLPFPFLLLYTRPLPTFFVSHSSKHASNTVVAMRQTGRNTNVLRFRRGSRNDVDGEFQGAVHTCLMLMSAPICFGGSARERISAPYSKIDLNKN